MDVAAKDSEPPAAIPIRERVIAGTLVAVLCLAALTGVAVEFTHVRPENLLSADRYNQLFSLHGMFTVAAISLPLIGFALLATSQCRSETLRFLLIALAALASALVVTLFQVGTAPLGTWATAVFQRLLASVHTMTGAAAMVAAWARHREHGATVLGLPLAVGGVSTVLLGLAGVVSGTAMPGGRALLDIVLAVTLAALAEPPVEKRTSFGLRVVLTLGVLVWLRRFVPLTDLASTGVTGVLAVVWLVVVGWVAARVCSDRRPSLVRAATWLAFAVYVEVAIPRGLLGTLDPTVHLHDTLFATATVHGEYFAVVFTLLAMWLRTRELAPTGGRTTAVALGAVAISFHAWLFQQFLLGTRGMPRRSAAYLPQFEALHVGSAVAGVAFYIALAWFVLRLVRLGPKRVQER